MVAMGGVEPPTSAL